MSLIPFTQHSVDALDTLIVIGTSTGGPQALTSLMESLPLIERTACCIVQHMPAGFTANLARRLNQVSAWHVSEATHQEQVRPGCAYVAPGGCQMRIEPSASTHRLSVGQTGLVNGHQPAVDVLFHSAVSHWPKHIVGVLLTGMGKDGSIGLKAIRDHGGFTIAEAESSCVVYGMPKAAVHIGAVVEVVPLSQVHEAILRGCRPGRTV